GAAGEEIRLGPPGARPPVGKARDLGAVVQDGPFAVAGQRTARREHSLAKVLRPHRLDRVAEDPGQNGGHFDFALSVGAAGLRLKPSLMLPKRSGRFPCIDMILYCWMKVIVLLAIQ